MLRGEAVLRAAALVLREAGVVRHRVEAFLAQLLRERVDVAAAHAVDDPGLPLVPLQHRQHLRPLVVARQHAVGEVGAVEVADEHERVAQGELLGDVAPHLLRRRGRIRVHRGLGELLVQHAELPVLGPEVVAPVADAVRLVDGERAHLRLAQERAESRHGQALRRDEEELDLSTE